MAKPARSAAAPGDAAESRAGAARPRRVRPFPYSELPRLLRAQVELGRAVMGFIGPALDAALGLAGAGWARSLTAALGGRLRIRTEAPYLLPVDRLRELAAHAVLVPLELQLPSRPTFFLAIDEALLVRRELAGGEGLRALLMKSLKGAPILVGEVGDAELLAGLDGASGSPALLMDLDVTVHDSRGAVIDRGWARLFSRSDVRLAAPPQADTLAAQGRWLQRGRLEGLGVELRIEAGYGFLPAREVTSLAVGDVVILDHFGPQPVRGGPVFLRLGDGVFPAHLDGSGATVLGSFHLRKEAMTDRNKDEKDASQADDRSDPTMPGEPPSEALLRELPIQLTCELGRVTISARELLELRPGAVLPVGRPLAGPVDLTASGRTIARGELVDVEGEIGVRLTELVE